MNYPAYSRVRSSFSRRRLSMEGKTNKGNPFDIPNRLKYTKQGSIKLALSKPILESDRWDM